MSTSPLTRHLRMIADDIADEHKAGDIRHAADLLDQQRSVSEQLVCDADRRMQEDMTLAWNSRKAAIEECAQIAERDRCRMDCGDAGCVAAKGIAKAIRALTDDLGAGK